MPERKRFSQEFKLEAVRLLKAGQRPVAELARELGVPRNRLYKWAAQVSQKGGGAFPGSGRGRGAGGALARVKQELVRVTEERDILRKAAAYFAKELG